MYLSIFMLASSMTVSAANNDLPNGKPFQELQTAIDAEESARQSADSALQSSDSAIKAQLAAEEAARIAADAAEAIQRATDDAKLQGLIDAINVTLEEQVANINAEIKALEEKITAVQQGSAEADALQDQIIQRLGHAINSLGHRADAIEEVNRLQNEQITKLWARAQSIETNTDAQFVEARAKYLDLEGAISDALARANAAYSLASVAQAKANAAYALADDDANYDNLLEQLKSVKVTLNVLVNHIGTICSYDYYVVGINADGSVKCRKSLQYAYNSASLKKYSYCKPGQYSDVFGCLDWLYYVSGTVYCPSGYKRVSSTVSTPSYSDHYSGSNLNHDYTYAATYTSATYDDEITGSGTIRITCYKQVNIDIDVSN